MMKKLIGYFLISLPILFLVASFIYEGGIKAGLILVATTCIFFSLVWSGISLLKK